MKNLLLVENENSENIRISSVLSKYQYNVRNVNSSSEGLEYIKENHPEILIIDLEGNEKEGLSLILETSKLKPRTSVLVLASTLDTDLAQQGLECGAEAFIHKPVDEEALIKYLNKKRIQQAM